MAEPPVLFCVGATKSGTSWLYRALYDHPGCALKSVKELHYWDTFDAEARAKQVRAWRGRIDTFLATKAEAEVEGRGWQVDNMQRQLRDLAGLIDVIQADRTRDAAYAGWLAQAAEGRLVADITPSYALLPEPVLARMVAAYPDARWIYLIRDPLERLWSHVRMQAHRQRQPHEAHRQKSNGILRRILHKGHEAHIITRGDYAATVARLRAFVPKDRLRVEFCEQMFTSAGWGAMCTYLNIEPTEVDWADPAHASPKAGMDDDLKPLAVRFLRQQYDWAAHAVGPLPDAWRRNLAKADE